MDVKICLSAIHVFFPRYDLSPPGLVTDTAGEGAGGPSLRHPQSSLTWTGVAEMWRQPGGSEEGNKETKRQREKEEGEGTRS